MRYIFLCLQDSVIFLKYRTVSWWCRIHKFHILFDCMSVSSWFFWNLLSLEYVSRMKRLQSIETFQIIFDHEIKKKLWFFRSYWFFVSSWIFFFMISWLSDRRSLSVLNHFLSTQFFRDQLHRVLKNPKMCYMDKVLMIVMGRNSSSQSIFLYITFKITTCVLLSHQKLLFLLKADEWSLLSRNFFCTRSVLEKFDSLLIYIGEYIIFLSHQLRVWSIWLFTKYKDQAFIIFLDDKYRRIWCTSLSLQFWNNDQNISLLSLYHDIFRNLIFSVLDSYFI